MPDTLTQDLADRHELISDLFTIPKNKDEWEAYRLTDEQIAHYEEFGYLAGIRIFTDEQVDVLREELTRMFSPDHPSNDLFYEYHSNQSEGPSGVLFHALGSWRVEPGFHDALWNPAFTMAAAQLLGGATRFWHDQLFCKPAKHGGVVAWHQDYSYWQRSTPMGHLTTWIGLDDADESNGCLLYIPKSHKWDLLPITGLAGDMDAIKDVLTDEQWEMMENPKPICLKKGEATFHHPLMVHGSRENHSDRPRRALVLNTQRDGTLSDTNEPLLAGVPAIPKGQKIAGKFFPELLDPAKVGF